MNATFPYRLAAALLMLFAAGHTFGFLAFRPPSREGLAVRDAMNNVAFQFKGSSYTYGNFYKGFGLTLPYTSSSRVCWPCTLATSRRRSLKASDCLAGHLRQRNSPA